MNFKTFFTAAVLCIMLFSATMKSKAQTFLINKPVTWQNTLRRINMQDGYSVLGVKVGKAIGRIRIHHQEQKELDRFFASLPVKKASACKMQYTLLKRAVAQNPVLGGYLLTARPLRDFCTLSAQNRNQIIKMFQNKITASSATQYQNAILLRLDVPGANLWFVILPNKKLISYTFNDPADFDFLPELDGPSRNLPLR